MCVYIHVEIEVVVFYTLFPITWLLRQVIASLASACKQISLQAPVNKLVYKRFLKISLQAPLNKLVYKRL